MNILITGGTGLIGEALINILLQANHHISVLTRNPQKARNILPANVQPVQWDGSSLNGLTPIIEETDAVINLVGESIAGKTLTAILTHRWTDEQKNRIKNSRVEAGIALTKSIQNAKTKPRVFIQASAVGYYGPQGDADVYENTPSGQDFLAEACQVWEESTKEVEKSGIRRIIIRSGLVLAADGGILPIMLLPFRLFVGGPIGSGRQYVPWIHIQDHVEAIRYLLTDETAQGPYNLTAPNPVRNAEFGRIAGKVLGRPNFFPTPAFALKLVLGEKASLVLDGQRVIPKKLLNTGFKYKFEMLEPALKDLVG